MNAFSALLLLANTPRVSLQLASPEPHPNHLMDLH